MITRLKLSIEIKANKSSIWNALWQKDFYSEWAGVFFEGSYAVTDHWEEGSKVHFLAPDKSGIYSLIEKHIPLQTIQFRHIGKVAEGKEQPLDNETKKWSGTTEMYSIIEGKNENTLAVELDVLDEHLEFMKDKFPHALQKIKANCE